MRPSREDILQQFRACATKLGKPPGLRTLKRMTGIKRTDVEFYWPKPAALAKEAGFTPNKRSQLIPESEQFESYARICQHLKKLATFTEVGIIKRELGFKVHDYRPISTFRPRFKLWLESGPPEFREILNYPGWEMSEPRPSSMQDDVPSQLTELSIHPFLPACVQYLDVLAHGENPLPGIIENVNLEFERRCADAFRCLGFEVEQLGQGRGRKADCLAMARREGFGIIVDAKVRVNGYALGTEDRKFLEYAKTHTRELNLAGIEKVYLVVVGSGFRDDDLTKLTRYLTDSPIRSVDLISAKALMRMVEESISERHRFQLTEIAQMLFGNKIIAE